LYSKVDVQVALKLHFSVCQNELGVLGSFQLTRVVSIEKMDERKRREGRSIRRRNLFLEHKLPRLGITAGCVLSQPVRVVVFDGALR
jgi:hypothetical protein